MGEFFQILGAVGDGAVVAVAFALWKLDRRLLAVEINLRRKVHGDNS